MVGKACTLFGRWLLSQPVTECYKTSELHAGRWPVADPTPVLVGCCLGPVGCLDQESTATGKRCLLHVSLNVTTLLPDLSCTPSPSTRWYSIGLRRISLTLLAHGSNLKCLRLFGLSGTTQCTYAIEILLTYAASHSAQEQRTRDLLHSSISEHQSTV